MFHTLRPLAALVVMLGVVSPAAALTVHYERERFGSAPKVQEPPNADGLWVLRHGPKVVYEKEAGWSGFGQMQDEVVIAAQGGVDDVNDALTQFALIPAEERVLRLFPGPGSVYSLKGQRVACDWQIHWTSHHAFPRGERKDNTTSRTAVLTIYVARTGAIPPADPRAHGWIADLNDDRFEVRQRATGALAALGDAAIPVLRQALKGALSIEQRRRIDLLLERLQPIHLAWLDVPRGLPIVSLDQLVEQETKDWRSKDLGTSYRASCAICEFAEYTDAAWPALVEALHDSRDMVRDQAVKTFGRLGKRAAPLLPELRAAAQASAAQASAARPALPQAIAAIEGGADLGDAAEQERARRRRYDDIAAHCRALRESKTRDP